MSDDLPVITDAVWVNTTEASQILGYNPDYLQQLARKISRQPEEQRMIKIRNRSRRYELWLPDLVKYAETHKRDIQNPLPE